MLKAADFSTSGLSGLRGYSGWLWRANLRVKGYNMK